MTEMTESKKERVRLRRVRQRAAKLQKYKSKFSPPPSDKEIAMAAYLGHKSAERMFRRWKHGDVADNTPSAEKVFLLIRSEMHPSNFKREADLKNASKSPPAWVAPYEWQKAW